MMVDTSARSVIAQFADADEHEVDARLPVRTAARFAGSRREQPSYTRFATEARYSRRRVAGSPAGARRKLRKA